MLFSTTITSKWQMTIPKEVRKMLGLKKPGKVVITMEPNRKAFMIEQSPSIFDFSRKYKPKRNRHVDPLKAREYFERHYART